MVNSRSTIISTLKFLGFFFFVFLQPAAAQVTIELLGKVRRTLFAPEAEVTDENSALEYVNQILGNKFVVEGAEKLEYEDNKYQVTVNVKEKVEIDTRSTDPPQVMGKPGTDKFTVEVAIIQAIQVPKADKGNTELADPYATVKIGKHTFTTASKEKTAEPKWNQHALISGVSVGEEVKIEVWDKDTEFYNPNDKLAATTIKLQDLPYDGWLMLKTEKEYQPQNKYVFVRVILRLQEQKTDDSDVETDVYDEGTTKATVETDGNDEGTTKATDNEQPVSPNSVPEEEARVEAAPPETEENAEPPLKEVAEATAEPEKKEENNDNNNKNDKHNDDNNNDDENNKNENNNKNNQEVPTVGISGSFTVDAVDTENKLSLAVYQDTVRHLVDLDVSENLVVAKEETTRRLADEAPRRLESGEFTYYYYIAAPASRSTVIVDKFGKITIPEFQTAVEQFAYNFDKDNIKHVQFTRPELLVLASYTIDTETKNFEVKQHGNFEDVDIAMQEEQQNNIPAYSIEVDAITFTATSDKADWPPELTGKKFTMVLKVEASYTIGSSTEQFYVKKNGDFNDVNAAMQQQEVKTGPAHSIKVDDKTYTATSDKNEWPKDLTAKKFTIEFLGVNFDKPDGKPDVLRLSALDTQDCLKAKKAIEDKDGKYVNQIYSLGGFILDTSCTDKDIIQTNPWAHGNKLIVVWKFFKYNKPAQPVNESDRTGYTGKLTEATLSDFKCGTFIAAIEKLESPDLIVSLTQVGNNLNCVKKQYDKFLYIPTPDVAFDVRWKAAVRTTKPPPPEKKKKGLHKTAVILLSIFIPLTVIGIAVLVAFCCKRRSAETETDELELGPSIDYPEKMRGIGVVGDLRI